MSAKHLQQFPLRQHFLKTLAGLGYADQFGGRRTKHRRHRVFAFAVRHNFKIFWQAGARDIQLQARIKRAVFKLMRFLLDSLSDTQALNRAITLLLAHSQLSPA